MNLSYTRWAQHAAPPQRKVGTARNGFATLPRGMARRARRYNGKWAQPEMALPLCHGEWRDKLAATTESGHSQKWLCHFATGEWRDALAATKCNHAWRDVWTSYAYEQWKA